MIYLPYLYGTKLMMKETNSKRKKIRRKGEAKEDKHIKRPKKLSKAKFKNDKQIFNGLLIPMQWLEIFIYFKIVMTYLAL